jgi:hypothetical protein
MTNRDSGDRTDIVLELGEVHAAREEMDRQCAVRFCVNVRMAGSAAMISKSRLVVGTTSNVASLGAAAPWTNRREARSERGAS